MTNEEAKAYFKRHINLYCVDGISREAEEMAIKALEQQLCDDAISRDVVLNTEYQVKIINDIEYVMLSEVQMKIRKMPPVTPKQKYGKWIEHLEIETNAPEYLMFYECSECGDKPCFCKSDIHKKRFCSNCGAKMESEVEE